MPYSKRVPNTGITSIPHLILAAVTSCVMVLVAGFLIYSNTQALSSIKDSVAHTQELLTLLQSTSQQADRVEFGTRIYALNKDENKRDMARISAFEMEAGARQLKSLVADNSQQTQNVENLTTYIQTLNSDIQKMSAQDQPPAESLLRCRETLKLMTEQEQMLLKQRNQSSEHRYIISLTTEWAFVGFFLIKVLALFGFLLREALLRRNIARLATLTSQDLTNSVHALEEAALESRLLASCSDELQLCVQVDQIYRLAADCLNRMVPGTSGSLCMINHSRNMLEVFSTWGSSAMETGETFTSDSCCGLRLGQLRWRSPGVSEIHCTHFPGAAPARYLCVPLVAQGETMGVLYVECIQDEAHLAIMHHMIGMRQILLLTGLAVAALHLRQKLENQAIRDSLTGLFNRHFMEVVLQREISRAARQHGSLAVFMLDVDHFKRFNDTHGHAAGDAMLKAVGETFQANVRTEDTVCRYGGEEFTIILPGISHEVACLRAELIRLAISRLRVPLQSGACGETTISIGMAFYPSDGTVAEPLLYKADQALYLAKLKGRNQVAVSELVTAA